MKRRINDNVVVQLDDGTTMRATILKIFEGDTYLAKSGIHKGFIHEAHILPEQEAV
jgi:hypothetical protein